MSHSTVYIYLFYFRISYLSADFIITILSWEFSKQFYQFIIRFSLIVYLFNCCYYLILEGSVEPLVTHSKSV